MNERLLRIWAVVATFGLGLFLLEWAVVPRTLFEARSSEAPPPETDSDPPPEAEDDLYRIVLTEEMIADILQRYARRREAVPHPAMEAVAVEEFIKTEILAREAMQRGLHKNDTIIRDILAEKMAILLNTDPLPPVPDDAFLREVYEENIADFYLPERVTVQQVFVDPGHPDLSSRAEEIRFRLNADEDLADIRDETALPPGGPLLRGRTTAALAQEFGDDFGTAVAELPLNEWRVVESVHGFHVLRVTHRREERTLTLDEARSRLVNMWQQKWLRENATGLQDDLRGKYTVVGWPRERPRIPTPPPTATVEPGP